MPSTPLLWFLRDDLRFETWVFVQEVGVKRIEPGGCFFVVGNVVFESQRKESDMA